MSSISSHTANNPMGSAPVGKLVAKFAVPSITAMLVSTLYNIVDQIFIGWGVGYLGNAATTVAFPLTTICLALGLLNGVGSAACFSLQLGKGEASQARKIAGCGLSLSIVLGTCYFLCAELLLPQLLSMFGATAQNYPLALEYSRIVLAGMPFLIFSNVCSNLIRADGSPSYSMLCMVSGAVVNCILDPLFILVFHWGMQGAAAATIIGQIVSAGFAAGYLRKFQNIQLTGKDFRLDWRISQQTFALGMSSSLNQIAVLIVQVSLNNMLKKYGAVSIYGADIPIAAAGISLKLYGLFNAVVVGLSQGCQPIFGFNYGAAKYSRVKKTLLYAITVSILLGSCIELVFQLFPVQCIQMFGNGDPLYLEFGSRFLRTYLLSLPVLGIQMISSNYFAAIGQPLKGVVLSLSRQVILFVPLVLMLPRYFGLTGILYAAPIADVSAAAAAAWMVYLSFQQMNALMTEGKSVV